jgi:4-hydroxy-3-methylbut-2-en-1-yl diphosphate synthase IspG/GcpE
VGGSPQRRIDEHRVGPGSCGQGREAAPREAAIARCRRRGRRRRRGIGVEGGSMEATALREVMLREAAMA